MRTRGACCWTTRSRCTRVLLCRAHRRLMLGPLRVRLQRVRRSPAAAAAAGPSLNALPAIRHPPGAWHLRAPLGSGSGSARAWPCSAGTAAAAAAARRRRRVQPTAFIACAQHSASAAALTGADGSAQRPSIARAGVSGAACCCADAVIAVHQAGHEQEHGGAGAARQASERSVASTLALSGSRSPVRHRATPGTQRPARRSANAAARPDGAWLSTKPLRSGAGLRCCTPAELGGAGAIELGHGASRAAARESFKARAAAASAPLRAVRTASHQPIPYPRFSQPAAPPSPTPCASRSSSPPAWPPSASRRPAPRPSRRCRRTCCATCARATPARTASTRSPTAPTPATSSAATRPTASRACARAARPAAASPTPSTTAPTRARSASPASSAARAARRRSLSTATTTGACGAPACVWPPLTRPAAASTTRAPCRACAMPTPRATRCVPCCLADDSRC